MPRLSPAAITATLSQGQRRRLERYAAFVEGLTTCCCPRPLPARRYLRVWACRSCALPIQEAENVEA